MTLWDIVGTRTIRSVSHYNVSMSLHKGHTGLNYGTGVTWIVVVFFRSRSSPFLTESPPSKQGLSSIPLLRSFHWLTVKFKIFCKISLLTYKTIVEKQPVYLHSILASSLPSRSLRSNNEISPSPRVKTSAGGKAFYSCVSSIQNNLPLSGHSATSVATFKKHLKTHPFDLAFPLYRHQHTQWPVDVMELLHWFCCWTPIRLSHHWALPR